MLKYTCIFAIIFAAKSEDQQKMVPENYPLHAVASLHFQAHAKELQTFESGLINQNCCVIQQGTIINYVVRKSIKSEISKPTPIFKIFVQYLF